MHKNVFRALQSFLISHSSVLPRVAVDRCSSTSCTYLLLSSLIGERVPLMLWICITDILVTNGQDYKLALDFPPVLLR